MGLAAIGNGRRDEAGEHFLNALDAFETLDDVAARRSELGSLASLLERTGMYDIAVMVAEAAIGLDRTTGENRRLGEDLLSLGNAWTNLGNTEKAAAAYEEALSTCLDNGFFDNAASASTNLAGLAADDGRMDEAIGRLDASLGYLEKQPHDDTEVTTRLVLVQILAITKQDDERAIAVAQPLFDRFGDRLRPDQLDVLGSVLGDVVDRYLAGRPELEPAAWKTANLGRILA